MSILKRLFGTPVRDGAMPASAQGHLAQDHHDRARNTPPDYDSETIVFREEVFDARNRLCGYRFTPRAPQEGRVVQEPLFFKALQDAHVVEFAERRTAFIPLGIDAVIFSRHAPLIAPNAWFILNEQEVAGDHMKLAGRLSAIRGAGGRTGVSGFTVDMVAAPFLEQTDMVVFSMSDAGFGRIPAAIATLRSSHSSLQIAVEGVNSWAERRLCASWCVDFCLGSFLSTVDKEEPERVLDQGRLTTLEMLNLLRNDADLSELAEVAKRDPGATFQLLKWANSPAMGMATIITSLSQAIMVVGREQMCRWLMVSMFRKGHDRARDESLLEVALTRARFLETLPVGGLSQAQRNELFLVGLMSVFDALLSMPMAKVLEHMHVSAAVHDVLLLSDGPYSKFLMLTLTVEHGSPQQIAGRALAMDIGLPALEETRQSSFDWAQTALSSAFAS